MRPALEILIPAVSADARSSAVDAFLRIALRALADRHHLVDRHAAFIP
jgi:hypothetical protein